MSHDLGDIVPPHFNFLYCMWIVLISRERYPSFSLRASRFWFQSDFSPFKAYTIMTSHSFYFFIFCEFPWILVTDVEVFSRWLLHGFEYRTVFLLSGKRRHCLLVFSFSLFSVNRLDFLWKILVYFLLCISRCWIQSGFTSFGHKRSWLFKGLSLCLRIALILISE